jgi:hypothetical protein
MPFASASVKVMQSRVTVSASPPVMSTMPFDTLCQCCVGVLPVAFLVVVLVLLPTLTPGKAAAVEKQMTVVVPACILAAPGASAQLFGMGLAAAPTVPYHLNGWVFRYACPVLPTPPITASIGTICPAFAAHPSPMYPWTGTSSAQCTRGVLGPPAGGGCEGSEDVKLVGRLRFSPLPAPMPCQ